MRVTSLLLLWDKAMPLLKSGICQAIIIYVTVKCGLGTLLERYLTELLCFFVSYKTFNVRIIMERSGRVLR
jgi:hypothetical protein